jgi:hypothetical protein
LVLQLKRGHANWSGTSTSGAFFGDVNYFRVGIPRSLDARDGTALTTSFAGSKENSAVTLRRMPLPLSL